MHRHKVGSILVATGLGLAVASCGSVPSSQVTATPVTMTYVPGASFTALVQAAQEFGFFSKNHLKVTLIPTTNGPTTAAAVASGAADVGANAPEVFTPLAARGVGVQLISGTAESPVSLVAPASYKDASASFPGSLRGLVGGTIGVTALKSAIYYMAEELLRAAHIPLGSVQLVAYGTDAAALAALQHGTLSAALVVDPIPFIAKADFGSHILLNLATGLPDTSIGAISENGLWALTSWVRSHRTTVTRIQRAMAETDLYLHEPSHLGSAVKLLGSELPPGFSQSARVSYTKAILPTITAAYSPDALSTWLSFDLQYGVIGHALTVKQVLAAGTPSDLAALKRLAADS